MIAVADTCSLLALSKYYAPFDTEHILYDFLRNSFLRNELIIVDAIHKEMKYVSQGIITKSFSFLDEEKEKIVKTDDMFPPSPAKFSRQLDNNFCVSIERKRMDDNEYEKQKQQYLSTGDAKIVIYSLCQITGLKNWINEDLFVLTEETRSQNDGKLFKKLPLICDGLNIKTIKVVDYLEKNGISLKIENMR